MGKNENSLLSIPKTVIEIYLANDKLILAANIHFCTRKLIHHTDVIILIIVVDQFLFRLKRRTMVRKVSVLYYKIANHDLRFSSRELALLRV